MRVNQDWLILVSKNELKKGKSGSFDGTDDEWLSIVCDALYSTEKEDVQVIAQMNKSKDRITVLTP